jgi:hypothetical protein
MVSSSASCCKLVEVGESDPLRGLQPSFRWPESLGRSSRGNASCYATLRSARRPQGVGVVIKAEHSCRTRVNTTGSLLTMSRLLGVNCDHSHPRGIPCHGAGEASAAPSKLRKSAPRRQRYLQGAPDESM